MAEDGAAELAVDTFRVGGVGRAVDDCIEPLLIIPIELIGSEVDTADIEGMGTGVDFDAEMRRVGLGIDVGEGEFREDD